MRLDHLLSKEIIFSLCHVSSCWWRVAFLFLGGTPTQSDCLSGGLRVRVMILSVCAFLWCWLVVGALLGVWDDTLVVVPVYRLLRAAGRLLFGGLCVVCGCCVRTG